MTSSIAFTPGHLMAQGKSSGKIVWSVPSQIPAAPGMDKQLGLAGVFTGQSNGVLIVAGGSNFADGAMPWQGGKKLHYDDVYVLQKTKGDSFTWLKPQTNHLLQKIAYGTSTTIPQGIVCAGGETETEPGSTNAFIMSWDSNKQDVVFTALPSLPIPLANACMSSIGQVIYLIGGECGGKPSAKCFMLNLAGKDPRWKVLPALPVAMSHSVAVTQSNGKYPCIYVIGGRSATASGISDLHGYTFCYDPLYNKWIKLGGVGDGKHTTNISAATAVTIGTQEILLIGGDKGNVFHQIETYNALIAKAATEQEKQTLQQQKLVLLNNHQGFSKDVYLFNTVKHSWKKVGELPFYGQVTTTAVKWNNEIFIPGGEIKPGVRTAAISMGKLNIK
ncbi:cyclically-permuted mutarotase family protein [Mucilaginibacter pineti]|uniref:Cyclically-permuted mutarotase family protein n=1 Tax=Mucilaginibacter pineti TaxID=1391627 RepID=A0A1G7LQ08_9SPHI|nr:kelch repeat-containing protein [Mucilaginibacter pineti]SDF51039.1 cyclically-permuted mutarotase family protein [Mucilaginibacter pineti]